MAVKRQRWTKKRDRELLKLTKNGYRTKIIAIWLNTSKWSIYRRRYALGVRASDLPESHAKFHRWRLHEIQAIKELVFASTAYKEIAKQFNTTDKAITSLMRRRYGYVKTGKRLFWTRQRLETAMDLLRQGIGTKEAAASIGGNHKALRTSLNRAGWSLFDFNPNIKSMGVWPPAINKKAERVSAEGGGVKEVAQAIGVSEKQARRWLKRRELPLESVRYYGEMAAENPQHKDFRIGGLG